MRKTVAIVALLIGAGTPINALSDVGVAGASVSSKPKPHVIFTQKVVNDQAQQNVYGPFTVPKSDSSWDFVVSYSTPSDNDGVSGAGQWGVAPSKDINGNALPLVDYDPGAATNPPFSGHKTTVLHKTGKFWLWVSAYGSSWTVTIDS